jgi:hypothetical protein
MTTLDRAEHSCGRGRNDQFRCPTAIEFTPAQFVIEEDELPPTDGEIHSQTRLGGLLKHCYCDAAAFNVGGSLGPARAFPQPR